MSYKDDIDVCILCGQKPAIIKDTNYIKIICLDCRITLQFENLSHLKNRTDEVAAEKWNKHMRQLKQILMVWLGE